MKVGLLLIALGFGYKVYAEASGEKRKKMKRLGRAVGVAMMVIAALGTICGVSSKIMYGKYGYCQKSGKTGWGGICPFSKKPIDTSITEVRN
jgi:hypothetical protein